jgi:hypothetical protein
MSSAAVVQIGELAPEVASAVEVEHQVGELAPEIASAAEVEHQIGELAPGTRAVAEVGDLAPGPAGKHQDRRSAARPCSPRRPRSVSGRAGRRARCL